MQPKHVEYSRTIISVYAIFEQKARAIPFLQGRVKRDVTLYFLFHLQTWLTPIKITVCIYSCVPQHRA